MFNRLFAIGALVLLTACASSDPKTFSGQFEAPPAQSRILMMTPDVSLAMLLATGLEEPRANWSQAGRDNLAAAISQQLTARNHTFSSLNPNSAMSGREGQIIRLHGAVGSTIILTNYVGLQIPTRRGRFEWTLGEGVREIAEARGADYALFVRARGTYASSGRVITMIGMAALGAAVPLGGQQAFASLVDLRTGNIIWFNVATAGANTDMREPEGAQRLVVELLRDVPL
jgi:hypothetical protein